MPCIHPLAHPTSQPPPNHPPAPHPPPPHQGNAVAGPGFAQWTASGEAFAAPLGDYGHKGARVDVQGFAMVDSGLYGPAGLAHAIHAYGL